MTQNQYKHEDVCESLAKMILVTEVDLDNDNTHTRYFWVDIDNGKDFCRGGRTSFNAFAHNWRKCRNLRPTRRKPRFLYHCQSVSFGQPVLMYTEAPRIGPVSLWDFYALIDYDYKTKRYRS